MMESSTVTQQVSTTTGLARYTRDELLRLQRKDIVVNTYIVYKLREHWELGDILRIPRRFGRPTTSEGLTDVTNASRPSTFRLSKRRSDSSEDLTNYTGGALKRDPVIIRWHLKERDSSSSSTKPLSAPVSLAAQQSENFRRFYRAVVSPTHVRVTAGGRIVPNTRSHPPPEWNPPKIAPELSPALPTSKVPIMASRYSNDTGANSHVSVENDQSTDTDAKAESSLPAMLTQPVKISPPSQFDHSKPFMYNGQFVYPLLHSMQPPLPTIAMTYGILGNLGVVPQHLTPLSPVHAAQFPYSMAPYPAFHSLSAAQPAIPTMPGGLPLENGPQLPPYVPGPGLPPMSELTKHQLQVYRSHLRFLDNQLANNKHQIDEAHMQRQREEVSVTIEKMESMLTIQLAHEYNATSKGKGNPPMQSVRQTSNVNSRIERSMGTVLSAQDTTPMFAKPPKVAVHLTAATDKVSDQNKVEKTNPRVVDRISVLKTSQPEQSNKSRLTLDAAKALPFQPRAKSIIAADQLDGIPCESRVGSTTPGPVYGIGSLPRVHASQSPLHATSSSTSHRAETFHGLPAAWTNVNFLPPTVSQPIPYLVGLLPQGIPASQATSMDLVYQRELTPEEIRARHIYWGKAPQPAHSGLPKFDGKDFYPPSPVTNMLHTVSNSPTTEVAGTVASTATNPLDFEALFDSPRSFKMTTPMRARPSLPLNFLNNGSSGSPSPQLPKNQQSNASSGLIAEIQVTKSDHTHSTLLRTSKCLKKAASDDFSHLFTSPEPHSGTIVEAREGVTMEQETGAEVITPDNSATVIKAADDGSFTKAEVDKPVSNKRANSVKADQQSLLLQNMLKNTTLAAMNATVKVSSTIARGFLPAYRGSAAVSLSSPTMPENNPPRVASSPELTRASAKGYMRYLASKADQDQKIIDGGWNASTDATGPVMGSDW